jgi:ferredoxin
MRETWTSRDVCAGCFTCHGNDAHWFHKGAQGTAATHHDRTGHKTWVEVSLHVTYGSAKEKRRA